jgi:hypothetical protein
MTRQLPIRANGRPRKLEWDDEVALVKWVHYQTIINLPTTKIKVREAAAKLVATRSGGNKEV